MFAPLRSGAVEDVFETITHAERARRVLRTLDAIRRYAREEAAAPSPFPDTVGRLLGIHFFRFTIVDGVQRREHPDSDALLYLNVTFDGGWEPYMRLIWGPLGTLLDLMMCSCKGYPLAHRSSYDEYIGWVREHEVRGDFFYADSAATVGDRVYHEQLEAERCRRGDQPDTDLRAAGAALRAPPPTIATRASVTIALTALRQLHALRPLFPAPTPADGGVLLRFAQESLSELRGWIAQGRLDAGSEFADLRLAFSAECQWLMQKAQPRPRAPERLKFDLQRVQAGIARGFEGAAVPTRGALVLLRVANATAARAWLSTAPVDDGRTTTLRDDAVLRHLAITRSGLDALGIHADWLRALPAEFGDGMDKRAGLLGDVRSNHPSVWRRPQRNWSQATQGMSAPAGPPLALATVHLLVQLRTLEQPGEAGAGNFADLLPRLATSVGQLGAPSTGLEVLAVQPLWSRALPPGQPAASGHMGFADGISQPRLDADSAGYWSDSVPTGELFIGYGNGRGDGPAPASPLLDDGSFVVLRSYSQQLGRIDRVLDRAVAALAPAASSAQAAALRETIRAKMMGRRSDGSPLVGGSGNDFNYRQDPQGAGCPFASHVRRSNPRDADPHPLLGRPRIARRGMSWGPQATPAAPPDDPRGLLFVAFCASIAEQFEIIQGWIAGGNSSGVASQQSDPFLGVPVPGVPRVFRYIDEQQRVVRIDLGDQPLIALDWGLYAFVPSLAALRWIGSEASAKPMPLPSQARAGRVSPSPTKPSLEQLLLPYTATGSRAAAWAALRAQGGVERLEGADGGAVLVGVADLVRTVFNDDGGTYSAHGYGERMRASLGDSPFGADDVGPHAGHAAPYVGALKQAVIGAVDEAAAFEAARRCGQAVLGTLRQRTAALGGTVATLSLEWYAYKLSEQLCRVWFGMPDDDRGGPARIGAGTRLDSADAVEARCPGNFLSVARYLFTPCPNATVAAQAKAQGQALQDPVKQVLDAAAAEPARLGSIGAAIVDVLRRHEVPVAEWPAIYANVVNGMPATLIGSLASVLVSLSASGRLWTLQAEGLAPAAPDGTIDANGALDRLRPPLLGTMARAPVAYTLWRTAVKSTKLGGVDIKAGDRIVIGVGSALAQAPGEVGLMFGDGRNGGSGNERHACPARSIAIGAQCGAIAALLQAGELRGSPDPALLRLPIG